MKFVKSVFLLICFSSLTVQSQDLVVFKSIEHLNSYIQNNSEKPLVINFWATWCAPCVKELPYFEQLHNQNKNIKVVTVSLDFENQVETRLKPFLDKKKYTFTTTYMADKKYNNWISQVSEDWSGSIPATWIITNDNRVFVEQEFASFEELNEFVNTSITK